MVKLSRNPVRWILALVLLPVVPFLVLLVANLGRVTAEKTWELAMPVLLDNPWMLIVMGALGPSLMIGFFAHLLFSSTCSKKHCGTTGSCSGARS